MSQDLAASYASLGDRTRLHEKKKSAGERIKAWTQRGQKRKKRSKESDSALGTRPSDQPKEESGKEGREETIATAFQAGSPGDHGVKI